MNQSQIRPDAILEGDIQEVYTPVAGPIKSAAMGNKVLQFVKFMVSVDSTVTWRDRKNIQKSFPLKAGIPYSFYATEISAVTASAQVLIIHDGLLDPRFD